MNSIIYRLLIATAFLMPFYGDAIAQTKGKLLEGAKTYFLDLVAGGECGVTKDFLKQKASFPLSYSALKPVSVGVEDIWVQIAAGLGYNDNSTDRCYGYIRVLVTKLNFGQTIKFNGKKKFSEITLFRSTYILTHHTKDKIGSNVEELMKSFVSAYNMDNK